MKPSFLLFTGALGLWIGSNAFAATQEIQTTNFAPLDYFNTSCARCHGNYGSFYGDTFGKKLSDAQMQEVVKAMADGPAQSPLSEENLKVLVGYHTSLRDGKPFLTAVASEKTATGWKLSGEVSPDSTLVWNEKPVEVTGHKWQLELPEAGPFVLRATKKEVSQELDLQKAAYTFSVEQPK